MADYSPLTSIFDRAKQQATDGKGRERHSQDRDFIDQPIMEIGRMLGGPGFEIGQAIKKAQEAAGMLRREDPEAAVRELLGAMNYLAAAVLLVEEGHHAQRQPGEPS